MGNLFERKVIFLRVRIVGLLVTSTHPFEFYLNFVVLSDLFGKNFYQDLQCNDVILGLY